MIVCAALLGALVWVSGCSSEHSSTCFGTSGEGALRDAWKLPRRGSNFRAYSAVGWLLGRTFVHSSVHAVVLEAYERLATSQPGVTFIYGETGLQRGGRFRPHRSHQNGLSVDFMVPVRDSAGQRRELPTSISDKFGYDLEFDDAGKLGDLQIDFELIARHLAELQRSASSQRVQIARVIFDPKLSERLKTTKAWPQISALPFMLKPAWIRHDEHYHVDFQVRCHPLSWLE